MADNDLIVVIPGITGSTLQRNGTEVWSSKPLPLLRMLATLFKHVRELELPDGIGDDAPEDGVHTSAVMPSLHFIPGVWSPIRGYEPLVGRLRALRTRLGDQPNISHLNPVVFPYDWRLSNRYTARQLKVYVEAALGRWRDSAPQNGDAKITFVCHSKIGAGSWREARDETNDNRFGFPQAPVRAQLFRLIPGHRRCRLDGRRRGRIRPGQSRGRSARD